MALFFVTLPDSQIEVDIPLIASFPGSGPWPDGTQIPSQSIPDAGIDLDLRNSRSIDDIAHGVDSELQAARALFGREMAGSDVAE